MPVYSFGYKKLQGYYYAEYKTIGYNSFPDIIYSISLDMYPFYTFPNYSTAEPFRKLKTQICLNLRNQGNKQKYIQKLTFSLYLINSKTIHSPRFADNRYKITSIFNIKFNLYKNNLFRYFSFKLNTDIYSNNQVIFWLETQKHFHYFSFLDGLYIRLFAGVNSPVFGTSGSYNFKLDEFYINRYEDQNYPYSILSHQFTDNYGGFAHFGKFDPKPILFSVNLKSTLPKIPIFKIFANFAKDANFIDQKGLKQFHFNQLHYETGIMLDLPANIISIYLPLIGSNYVTNFSDVYQLKWYQKIRFSLKLKNYHDIL